MASSRCFFYHQNKIFAMNYNIHIMKNNDQQLSKQASKVKPFVKWVGGKRQLLLELHKYLPKHFDTYYEPFVVGGALLFDLLPQKAVINDYNSQLINVYKVVEKGVFVIISNSEVKEVKELYSEKVFKIHKVQAKRSINSQGANRGNVGEVIIVGDLNGV